MKAEKLSAFMLYKKRNNAFSPSYLDALVNFFSFFLMISVCMERNKTALCKSYTDVERKLCLGILCRSKKKLSTITMVLPISKRCALNPIYLINSGPEYISVSV